MKKSVLKVVLFCIFLSTLFVGFSIQTSACEIVKDKTTNNIRYVEVKADNQKNDDSVLKNILDKSKENKLVLKLDKGIYKLTYAMHLYSNTSIDASGAKIYQTTDGKGILINAYYKGSPYGEGKGGYSSIKNIKITGGTWIGSTNPDKTKTFKKETGYYVGYSTFLFMHGQNIKIDHCSFKNNYNGHFIELAGINNAKICNCNMNVKGSSYIGELSNEGIQIDNNYQQSNSPVGSPWDDTASKNIVIDNCNIKFGRGIGTNRIGNTFFRNIKILNCNIISQNEGINLYDTIGAKIENCYIKTTCNKDDYTSTGVYVGLDSVVLKNDYSKDKIYIVNNTIIGYNSGLKICNPNKKTQFNYIYVKNNKLYSKKSKSFALTYSKNDCKKIILYNNKLSKI